MERTFSKMGGGKADNTQWYYIDKEQNYVGPVNTHKMRQLRKFEYVLAESYVWASHLSGWKMFNQIPELQEQKKAAKAAGAPPSLGMAKKPSCAAGSAAVSSAQAPPSAAMAGMSIEPEEEKGFRAARPNMQAAPDARADWHDDDGLQIVDENGKVRATIAADGEVKDGTGKTLAFIEPNGDCGSADMDYLGKASNDQVLDRDDKPVGAYDQGRGHVMDLGGSVVAEISKEGRVSGNGQQTAGKVDGWSFQHMQTLAAFILLVDADFTAGY